MNALHLQASKFQMIETSLEVLCSSVKSIDVFPNYFKKHSTFPANCVADHFWRLVHPTFIPVEWLNLVLEDGT